LYEQISTLSLNNRKNLFIKEDIAFQLGYFFYRLGGTLFFLPFFKKDLYNAPAFTHVAPLHFTGE